MLGNLRRIVTGHDARGRSVVVLKEPPAKLREFPAMGLGDAWITESVPADNSVYRDLAPTWPQLAPPRGGARIAWFWHGRDDPNLKWQRTGDPAIIMDDTGRHPSMHRTNTLDYVVLIKGRMRMLLDEGEVDLNPGDVVVQRGTNHAWTNLCDEPAVLLSVMMDAVPGVGRDETIAAAATGVNSPFSGLKRVITGHDSAGQAVVLYAGPPLNGGEIWQTSSLPADLGDARDLTSPPVALDPPRGGVTLRWFSIAPEDPSKSPDEAEREAAAFFASVGAAHARTDTRRHPGMHKTRSVDYIVCLTGNMTLLLDEGEVGLKPGDVVIQRGTSHAWVNRGRVAALNLAVMVDAKD